MSFDKVAGPNGNNDQWYAVIPPQNAGTQIWFYVRAGNGYGGATTLYAPGGIGNNYSFKFQ